MCGRAVLTSATCPKRLPKLGERPTNRPINATFEWIATAPMLRSASGVARTNGSALRMEGNLGAKRHQPMPSVSRSESYPGVVCKSWTQSSDGMMGDQPCPSRYEPPSVYHGPGPSLPTVAVDQHINQGLSQLILHHTGETGGKVSYCVPRWDRPAPVFPPPSRKRQGRAFCKESLTAAGDRCVMLPRDFLAQPLNVVITVLVVLLFQCH